MDGRQGVTAVPRLVATDRESNSALLTWAEGSLVRDVDVSDIDQAADFLDELHRLRETAISPRRIWRRKHVCRASKSNVRSRPASASSIDWKASRNCIFSWPGISQRRLMAFAAVARDTLSAAGLSFDTVLEQKWRSLVPSDFGFHNALRDERGRLTFIDFEYFGWDDPVKLTADVMLHPGTPVASELRLRFRNAAAAGYMATIRILRRDWRHFSRYLGCGGY